MRDNPSELWLRETERAVSDTTTCQTKNETDHLVDAMPP